MADILPSRPSVCPTCGRITDNPSALVAGGAGRLATYIDRLGHSWTVSWRDGVA